MDDADDADVATRSGDRWAATGSSIGRSILAVVVLGLGGAATVFAALDGRAVIAVTYAVSTVSAVLGLLGRAGIPASRRRSRLPVALQGALLGATLVAAAVAIATAGVWSHLVVLAWLPILFPEAVPAALFHRLAPRAVDDEVHVPTGPRWQDRPLSNRS